MQHSIGEQESLQKIEMHINQLQKREPAQQTEACRKEAVCMHLPFNVLTSCAWFGLSNILPSRRSTAVPRVIIARGLLIVSGAQRQDPSVLLLRNAVPHLLDQIQPEHFLTIFQMGQQGYNKEGSEFALNIRRMQPNRSDLERRIGSFF
jgi:hypothetical protein